MLSKFKRWSNIGILRYTFLKISYSTKPGALNKTLVAEIPYMQFKFFNFLPMIRMGWIEGEIALSCCVFHVMAVLIRVSCLQGRILFGCPTFGLVSISWLSGPWWLSCSSWPFMWLSCPASPVLSCLSFPDFPWPGCLSCFSCPVLAVLF